MSAGRHDAQSRHNKDVHDFLHTCHPKYVDWQITSLFYSVLHLVDAYLARNGIEPGKNHHARRKLVKRELSLLYDSYDTLYGLSITARYDVKNRPAEADWKTALSCFQHIKKYTNSM